MTQYYSRVDREFNGGSKIITVPFPYIKREDIEVLIDDNVITEWSWLNDSQITINTELISGNILSVCRTTEIDEKIVDYKNMGMVLNEDNLNASQDQLLYSIQELYDNNEVFKQDTNEILIDTRTELENTLEANKQELITAQETFENEINRTLLKNKQEVDTRVTEFENNVNSTIDEVLEAANKINELEESVEIATEAAEIANQKAEELKETAETISTQLIENTGKIEEALASFDTKAGIDLSNLSETGEKHFLNKSQITNCITEIPQRIKLELADGTLTLKAGSEVIKPNGKNADGSNKFDVVIIESDVLFSGTVGTGTRQSMWFLIADDITFSSGVTLGERPLDRHQSGTTTPSNNSICYYNINENLIYFNGTDNTKGVCLPLCIITLSNGVLTSIDQIFNGFGYIGSTIWIDKGVKFLASNGKNEDETLKNVVYQTDRVFTRNCQGITDTAKVYIVFDVQSSGNPFSVATIFKGFLKEVPNPIKFASYFNLIDNCWYYSPDGSYWDRRQWGCLGSLRLSDNGATINDFQPKQPFRAVDYNDLTDLMPTGAIISSASSTTPTGYLYCNGSAVSRTTYAKLFSAIGTTYGTGDGSTTFNLPNYSNYNFVTSSTVSVNGNGKGLMLTNGSVTSQLIAYSNDSTATFGPSKATSSVNYGTSGTKLSNTSSNTDSVYGVVTNASTSGLTGSVSTSTLKWYIKY